MYFRDVDVDYRYILQQAAHAARVGCNDTCEMTGEAGRSNYIRHEQMRGVPDPGALAVAVAFESFAAALESSSLF